MENVTFLLRGKDYFELQEFIRSPRHVLEPKNGKVEPKMDHFNDFQEKDGYESTKTQFLDKIFLVLGKYGPRVFKFDAFRHTQSTLQEYYGVENCKPLGIPMNITELPDEIDDSQYEIQIKHSYQKGGNSDFAV